MKKFLNISLILLITGYGLLITASSSHADRMTGGDYEIPASAVNSGGDRLTGGDYEMQDAKGEAAIGRMTGGDYELGLGVVYGILGEGAPTEGLPDEWVSDTHVENLVINRVNTRIVLSWGRPEGSPDAGSYYVFRLVPETGFENAPDNWERAAVLPYTDTVYMEEGQLGRGDAQVYYRVLSVDDAAQLRNKLPVGKININLSSSGLGYNYVSVPFTYRENEIDQVFEPSSGGLHWLDPGVQVFTQTNGFDFDIAELNSDRVWVSAFEASRSTDIGSEFHVYPQNSYMVKVPADDVYTVVGQVIAGADARTLRVQGSDHVGGNLYTYFGNFLPRQFVLSEATINDENNLNLAGNVAEGDRIFYATDTDFNFNIARFHDGQWRNEFDPAGVELTDMVLLPSLGYMYKRDGESFDWTR